MESELRSNIVSPSALFVAGSARVNLIRICCLVAFYSYHLIDVHFLRNQDAALNNYHRMVSLIAGMWTILVLAHYVCLLQNKVSPALAYVTIVADLALAVLLIIANQNGKTPLFVLLYLIVMSSTLRMDNRLVVFATIAGLLAGLTIFGWNKYGTSPPSEAWTRPEQIVLLLGIAMTGIFADQCTRQMRLIRSQNGKSFEASSQGVSA